LEKGDGRGHHWRWGEQNLTADNPDDTDWNREIGTAEDRSIGKAKTYLVVEQRSADRMEVGKKQDFRQSGKARQGLKIGGYIFYNFQLHPTDTVPMSTLSALRD